MSSRGRWGPVRQLPGEPAARPRRPGRSALGRRAEIAVVGLGCVLPGALDIPTFWRNLVEGVDSIGPIPPSRWVGDRYHDPSAGAQGPALTYSCIGGLVGEVPFDPTAFRIPPRVVPTLDPAQQLALLAARQAVEDAGWLARPPDPRRAAVVIGNAMGGEYAKDLALRVRYREIVDHLAEDPSLIDRDWVAIRARLEAFLDTTLPPMVPDSMAGLLSNIVAARVASWLGWMGGSFTVDAACAASLAAIGVAVDWLRSGRCDAVLAGGVDTDMSPETYVGFSRTEALSATGSSPFSQHADGFVMGEGAAVFALKRLDDALRDEDAVWAVIRGVGQSSDGRGRGITAPRPEGQRLALERAWADAQCAPGDAALVEAHGTGTQVGDATELDVLARVFAGARAPLWVGSVKSQIGHLKAAAGAAGFTKAVLALATGVVPPTLHAGPPHTAVDDGPLRLPRQPVAIGSRPRLAGVSAFGFGGTNFHVVLAAPPSEAHAGPQPRELARRASPLIVTDGAWMAGDASPTLLAWGASDRAALVDALERAPPERLEDAAQQPWRVVLCCGRQQRGPARVRAAYWIREGGTGSLGTEAFLGHGAAPPAVLLAPGQGAQRTGAVDALRCLPAGARALARLAGLPDMGAPADWERDAEGSLPSDPVSLHRLLIGLGVGWRAVLSEAGLPVACTVGHSLGELTALVAAGRLSAREGLRLGLARGRALAGVPPGAMLAVHLGVDRVRKLVASSGVHLAAVNGPEACTIAGPTSAVHAFEVALEPQVRRRRLPVARAFHTPAMAAAADGFAAALAAVTFDAGLPVVSTATTLPMGSDPAEALQAALVEPVRFAEVITDLARSHGLLVELGPGATLTGLARRLAPDATCIALDPGDPQGLAVAAACLAAAGHVGLARALPGTRVHLAPPVGSARAVPPLARAPAEARPAGTPRDAVIEAIADVSGYPPDLLEDDAELEADLGIGSIRKLEILGRVQERLGLSVTEADYAMLGQADVASLVAYAEAGVARGPAPAAAPRPTSLLWTWVHRPVGPAGAAEGALPEPGRFEPTDDGRVLWIAPEAPPEEVVAAWRDFAADRKRPPRAIVVAGKADHPGWGAAAGFALSLAQECGAEVRVVALDDPDPDVLRAELAATDRPAVVRVQGSCVLEKRPTALALAGGEPPCRRPFVVASGGGRGVVVACLLALAPTRARVLLFGRSDPADPAIAANLRRLVDAGLTVRWARCDLLDGPGVAEAVASARAAWGPVEAVIHGAGTLRDGPAHTRSDQDAAEVLGPKLIGARHLMAATAPDAPRLWLALSSLAAHGGNPGQTLYGAANAALERMAHPSAGRSANLASSAWSGLGLARGAAAALRARGVEAMEPAAAASAFAAAFAALWRAGAGPPVTWGMAAQTLPGATGLLWPLGRLQLWLPDRIVASVPLSPEAAALADHRPEGRSLVPAALWLCALRAAVRELDAAHDAWVLEHFAVRAPTFVDRARDDVTVQAFRSGAGWAGEVRAGGTVVATAFLRPGGPAAAKNAPVPLRDPTPGAALYRPDLLFHGPMWQVLAQVEQDGNGTARADLRPVASGLDPLAGAVDAAHQLLSAWAHRRSGWLGLPVGAGAWSVFGDAPAGPVRLVTTARPGERELLAQVHATDAQGRTFLVGRDVRLRRVAWSSRG